MWFHVRLHSDAVPGKGCRSPGLKGQPLCCCHKAGCQGKSPRNGDSLLRDLGAR